MVLFHSCFKISAYNLAFQLEEIHRFIITCLLTNYTTPLLFCNFLIDAGSHKGSTLKFLWKSCTYVTYQRRNPYHVGFSVEVHISHMECVLWWEWASNWESSVCGFRSGALLAPSAHPPSHRAQDAVTCCTWELALGMSFDLTKF